MKISPLAPKEFASLPNIEGVSLNTAAAGLKYLGRDDVMLMVFDEPANVAGVFTRSQCASAPVDFCKANLGASSSPNARAVLVNSGNANAFTGQKGVDAVEETAKIVMDKVACAHDDIYLASTGVIGEPMDASKFSDVIEDLYHKRSGEAGSWMQAAKAIMTTDTYPKVATRSANIGDVRVTINGMAKGSGMIAPDMATMLSFIVTDANISSEVLQTLLSQYVGPSFNSITVDSDTSTSDTVLLFATKKAGPDIIDAQDPRLADFAKAFADLMQDLALQIVRDGEGASKLLEITVTGATSDQSAKRIGMCIANSPLVKTAIAGEDANWGRVVMAIGKAGEPANRDLLSIWFGDIRVAHNGERDPDYSEEDASRQMISDEISLKVDLCLGDGEATVWTCDLTKEYVAINGDYRS